MTSVSVREARARLAALLDSVAKGEEVVILRRGEEVARLVPAIKSPRRLPALAAFRREIEVKGEPVSKTVVREREVER